MLNQNANISTTESIFAFSQKEIEALVGKDPQKAEVAFTLFKPAGEDENYACAFTHPATANLVKEQMGCPFPPPWPTGDIDGLAVTKETLNNGSFIKISKADLIQKMKDNQFVNKGIKQLLVTFNHNSGGSQVNNVRVDPADPTGTVFNTKSK